MNDASNAPEAVLTSISHKEVVPQPPRSPPGEYHQTQQSTGGFPQQQYPQQQQPQQQQQQQYPEQQQYSQQQQQQSQQYDAQPKPFDGSGYYSVTATGTPSQYGHLPASSHEEPKRPKEKTVCGLAKRTFIFIVILAVVVVGAAVGGAVGGSMAVQRSSQPQAATLSAASSSAAATPTNTVPQESTTTGGGSSTTPTSAFVQVPSEYGQLKLDCPNLDGTTKKLALDGTTWSFALECGVDFPGAKNDILALTVYTLDDCLRGCLSYNRNLGRPDCVGVAFNADMASNVNRNFGNCWVKNSTGTVRTNNSNRNVGALLQLK